MSIRIAVKYAPFTRSGQARCMLPGSPYIAKITPKNVAIDGAVIPFPYFSETGDVTIQQMIEKGYVRIFGKGKEGNFAYRLAHKGSSIYFYCERTKIETVFPVEKSAFVSSLPSGKLSLGCSKKQDIEQIRKRRSPAEYLPFLYHIGSGLQSETLLSEDGTAALVLAIEDAIAKKQKAILFALFDAFLYAGVESLFAPLLRDEKELGVVEGSFQGFAYALLARISGAIKSLFIQENEGEIQVLPCVPSKLVSGRFVDIPFSGGKISIEWTKGVVRKIEIVAEKQSELRLVFPPEISSYRVKKKVREQGTLHRNAATLFLEKGELYLLDRFQK